VIGGWLLKKYQNMDTRHLLTAALYVFSPALIFHALTNAEISSGNVLQILGFCICNLLLLWMAANVWGRLFHMSASDTAGLTLVSTFTNSVNYGLPLVLLALGQAGMDHASVYVVIQMIIVNTIGVYFAARSHFSIKDAVKSVFKLPSIYAMLAAAFVQLLHIPIPSGLEKGISMLSDSYAPLVLCILGAQMANVQHMELTASHRKAFWSGFGIRMLLSPVIAFLVLKLLHVEGTMFSVLLILASMPVAVNAVILAEKFDASPQFVSKCILWTTLASFIILPILMAAAGAIQAG